LKSLMPPWPLSIAAVAPISRLFSSELFSLFI
jgi:hypothetical protein